MAYNNFINLEHTHWAVLDLTGIGATNYVAPCRFQQLQRRYITDAEEVTSSEWDYMIVCKRNVPLDQNDELWIDGTIYHVQAVVRYTSHQEVTMITYNYTDPGFPYSE